MRTVAVLLLLAACGREQDPQPLAFPPPELGAIVDEALVRTAADALPEVEPERAREVAEWIDLAAAGGRAGERAARALAQDDPTELSAALLTLLESRENAVELRRSAYAWLRDRGVPSILPRLTLRLKYEKDWVANVDLALGLLRLGSGAGLDALVTILRAEDSTDPIVQEARGRAAAALAALPPRPEWIPGADFGADWAALLATQEAWLRHRERLFPLPAEALPPVAAEVWRMIARFRSQPLRPVDDARFVLVRLPGSDALPPLLAAAYDADLYVRDHALETLSWIGAPAGRWAVREEVDALGVLTALLGEVSTRPRALEALGALGQPEATPWLLPWLESVHPEERTAAADALLRCADASALAPVAAAWDRGGPWSAEAAYSLALLRQALDPTLPQPARGALDAAEALRREQWRAERAPLSR